MVISFKCETTNRRTFINALVDVCLPLEGAITKARYFDLQRPSFFISRP